jgi:hypothetical protein
MHRTESMCDWKVNVMRSEWNRVTFSNLLFTSLDTVTNLISSTVLEFY